MRPIVRLGVLLLLVAGATPPLRARPCDESDLEVLEALLAEVDDGPPADDTLRDVADEAGCEWLDSAGGPADELEQLRWRDGAGPRSPPADERDEADTWWRLFLPRVELRWVGERPAASGPDGSSQRGWQGRFELWFLWSLVPVP